MQLTSYQERVLSSFVRVAEVLRHTGLKVAEAEPLKVREKRGQEHICLATCTNGNGEFAALGVDCVLRIYALDEIVV